MSVAKEEARKLLERIPNNADWDDIMYEFYVRQKVETALRAADAADVVGHEEVKRRLLPGKRHLL